MAVLRNLESNLTIKYKRVPTSSEVYHTIVRQHFNKLRGDIGVFESYTDIVENGLSTIYTVWGLNSSEVALVGAKTTYESELVQDTDGEFHGKEIEGTRTSEYWLCSPYFDYEDE